MNIDDVIKKYYKKKIIEGFGRSRKGGKRLSGGKDEFDENGCKVLPNGIKMCRNPPNNSGNDGKKIKLKIIIPEELIIDEEEEPIIPEEEQIIDEEEPIIPEVEQIIDEEEPIIPEVEQISDEEEEQISDEEEEEINDEEEEQINEEEEEKLDIIEESNENDKINKENNNLKIFGLIIFLLYDEYNVVLKLLLKSFTVK